MLLWELFILDNIDGGDEQLQSVKYNLVGVYYNVNQ